MISAKNLKEKSNRKLTELMMRWDYDANGTSVKLKTTTGQGYRFDICICDEWLVFSNKDFDYRIQKVAEGGYAESVVLHKDMNPRDLCDSAPIIDGNMVTVYRVDSEGKIWKASAETTLPLTSVDREYTDSEEDIETLKNLPKNVLTMTLDCDELDSHHKLETDVTMTRHSHINYMITTMLRSTYVNDVINPAVIINDARLEAV